MVLFRGGGLSAIVQEFCHVCQLLTAAAAVHSCTHCSTPTFLSAVSVACRLSLCFCVHLMLLLLQELGAFLSVRTTSELVVDRSPQNELLKITFNVR